MTDSKIFLEKYNICKYLHEWRTDVNGRDFCYEIMIDANFHPLVVIKHTVFNVWGVY